MRELYTGAPIITAVSPRNGATSVSYLDNKIRITFSSNMAYDVENHQDLHRVTDPNYVYVTATGLGGNTTLVSGKLSYDAFSKTVTFESTSSFAPSTEYRIYVLGSNSPNGGVQDIRGNTLESTYISIFKTDAVLVGSPVTVAPVTRSTINSIPSFVWEPVEVNNTVLTNYTLQVSTHMDFSDLVFSVSDTFEIDEDGQISYDPDITLDDRTIYFWRVRVDGGEWSETSQFYYTEETNTPSASTTSIVGSIPVNNSYNDSITTWRIKLSETMSLEDIEDNIVIYEGKVTSADIANADLVPLTEVPGTWSGATEEDPIVFIFTPSIGFVNGTSYTLVASGSIEETYITFTKDTDTLYADPSTVLGSLSEYITIDPDVLITTIRSISTEAREIMENILEEQHSTLVIDWTTPPLYIANYVKYRVQEAILTEKYLSMSADAQRVTLADFDVSNTYTPQDLLGLLKAIQGQVRYYLDTMYNQAFKRVGSKVVSYRDGSEVGAGYPDYFVRSIVSTSRPNTPVNQDTT